MAMRPRFLLLAIAALSATSTLSAQEAPFSRIELRAGFPVGGPPVAARLGGGAASDLLVHGRDAGGLARMAIFSPDPARGWSSPRRREVEVPFDALFFDILRGADGQADRLAFLTPLGVRIFDPVDGGAPLRLSAVSIFRHASNPEFDRMAFAVDADGDGRDDLLIPDFDGHRLFLQTGDGGFSEPVFLGLPSEMRIGGFTSISGEPRYKAFPHHAFDADGDGRGDLVFHRGRELLVFAQGEDGGFASFPRPVPLGLPIVGNRWVDEIAAEDISANRSNFVQTRLLRIEDFDGDGIVDILTETERASGTFDRVTGYALHFGRGPGPVFDPVPDTSILVPGYVARLQVVDVDGDGRRDLVTASVDIGIGKIVGALLTGSTDFDLSFHRLGAGRALPETPDVRRKLSVGFDFSSGGVSIPLFALADVDGDGAMDLLLDDDKRGIRLFPSEPGKALFARRAIRVDVDLPGDGQLVDSADLDGDGGADILIRFDRLGADGADNRDRILLLLTGGREE